MKSKIPAFRSDEEAERFVSEADLSDYDLSGLQPVQFVFEARSGRINVQVPESLLTAVQERARTQGIPVTRYIRLLIEADVAKSSSPPATG